jgi:hypothetical protein
MLIASGRRTLSNAAAVASGGRRRNVARKSVAAASSTSHSACQLQLKASKPESQRQFDILHVEADMARIECNPIENVDGKFAIEEAIMGQLRAGSPAEVALADLEKCYDVASEGRVDRAGAQSSAATELAAKCDAICTNLARVLRSPVEYNKEDDFVEFRMVTARPK